MNVLKRLWVMILALGLPLLAEATAMSLEQVAYRWRNDNGSESAATWKATTNAPIIGVKRGENLRVRFAFWNAANTGPIEPRLHGRLEYAESLNGPWTPVGADLGRAFQMMTTAWYTNGQPTTAQLKLSGSTFTPGQCVASPASIGVVTNLNMNKTLYANIEYCFQATAYARRNTTYYFRVTQQGVHDPTVRPDTFAYIQYARLTMEDTDPAITPTNIYVDDDDANAIRIGPTLVYTSVQDYGTNALPAWKGACANTVGAWNGGSRYNNVVLTDTNVVAFRWIPSMVVATQYNVYARWVYDSHRGSYIPYAIRHANGTNEVFVNQRDPALSAKWNLLGTYTFNAGTNGWIEMGGNDGLACADAVKLEKVGGDVNEAPIANAQGVSTPEDTPRAITLTGCDPEGSNLTYTVLTQPTNGTLSGTAPNLTYTPSANYYGTNSFIFKVNDGALDSAEVMVLIIVTSVNDAPTCALTTPTNGAIYAAPASITLQATASDVDGTISKVEFFNGTNKLGQDTTSPYAYTWNNVAAGSYALKVKASDNNSATTTSAIVNITVSSSANQPPVITEGASAAVTMSEDSAPTAFNRTLHATDANTNTLTWSISAAAAHGTATASGTGASKAVAYTPVANYNGADSFVVQVSDGQGGTDTITVTVTIQAINDAPGVLASASTNSGIAPLTVNFTATGTDVDNDALSYAWTFGDGANSTNQNPSHVYVSSGSYTSRVTVSDGKGGSASVSALVAVSVANQPPVITEGASVVVTMSQNSTPTPFSLTLHATDANTNHTLTWSIYTQAVHGSASASGTGTNKVIGYIPATNYNGADSFVVMVSDGQGGTDTIMVNVTITPVVTGGVVQASGGIVTNFSFNGTNYTAHIFTNSGSLVISTGGVVEYLIVGAGGSGGGGGASSTAGGGGGAGGVLSGSTTITASTYTVTVGPTTVAPTPTSGSQTSGSSGAVSRVFGLTASGGGGGGGGALAGRAGGSGGGGGGSTITVYPGGSGSAGQGYRGGTNSVNAARPAGGGGGAGALGASASGATPGKGGNGVTNWILGAANTYAGGGGGGISTTAGGGTGGLGGGGAAGTNAVSGRDGTGGGGGGKSCNNIANLTQAGNGGSGIVIIRYVVSAAVVLSPYEQWQRAYFTTQALTNSEISGDNADPDHDGMSNLQEYLAGTIPTNSSSCLVFTADNMNPLNAGQFIVRWQSASNKSYTLQAATSLLSSFNLSLGTNMPATPPENVHTDQVQGVEQRFYRVLVE